MRSRKWIRAGTFRPCRPPRRPLHRRAVGAGEPGGHGHLRQADHAIVDGRGERPVDRIVQRLPRHFAHSHDAGGYSRDNLIHGYSLTCSTTYYYGSRKWIRAGTFRPCRPRVRDHAGRAFGAHHPLPDGGFHQADQPGVDGRRSGLTVTSYYVFRGASPTGLAQVATTKGTTYTDNTLSPSTTVLLRVEEVDSSGMFRPCRRSRRGPRWRVPLAPTNVAATATSTRQIGLTWVAGPSGLSVKSYAVFRGTSPLRWRRSETRRSFRTRTTLSPSTTYYYGVEEVDSGGNVSGLKFLPKVCS